MLDAREESIPEPEVLVLLSGGLDSAACVDFFLRLGRPLSALHISYGQPAETQERAAAEAIARHYRVPLRLAAWEGPTAKCVGLVPFRNAFLLVAAAMEAAPPARVIACGVHAGTPYVDCTPEFVDSMDAVVKTFSSRSVSIAAPFIEFTKADMIDYCLRNDVPVTLAYSCEAGTMPPCGACDSCKDREILNARKKGTTITSDSR